MRRRNTFVMAEWHSEDNVMVRLKRELPFLSHELSIRDLKILGTALAL